MTPVIAIVLAYLGSVVVAVVVPGCPSWAFATAAVWMLGWALAAKVRRD